MKTTVKKLSDTRIEINVSLDANDLAPARDFAIQQLSKELKVEYVPGELLEYSATADILPEVKLGDYKNLGVKKKTVTVNESDVKSILENIAGSFAEKKTVKRAAKLTD